MVSDVFTGTSNCYLHEFRSKSLVCEGILQILCHYSNMTGMKLYNGSNIIVYILYAYKLENNLFGVGRTYCRCRK